MPKFLTTFMSIAIYEELAKHRKWNIPHNLKLPEEDGEALEDSWHRYQINLFIDSINTDKVGRENFYVGGNMFLYFMVDQVEKLTIKSPTSSL